MKMVKSIKAIIAVSFAAAASSLGAGIVVSDGPATPGEWNSNLSTTVKAMKENGGPILIVVGNPGCTYCNRLKTAFDSVAFSKWQEDRKLYMAYVGSEGMDDGKRIVMKVIPHLLPFFKAKLKPGTQFPITYAYWQKPDGTEMGKIFSGRRGDMNGDKDDALAGEFASAVDKVLAEYIVADKNPIHRKWKDIAANAMKKISFATEGNGKVKMEPADGILSANGEITLSAIPAPDSVFVDWAFPSGMKGRRNSATMKVSGGMPEGVYTARFRTRSDIKPPILYLPSTALVAKVGTRLKFQIQVDDASRPLSFIPVKLPKGAKLTSDGLLTCLFSKNGTNTVEFAAEGNDVGHTVVTNRLTVATKRRNQFPRKQQHRRNVKTQ